MAREFMSQDYRFGLLVTLKHTSNHL